jgi:hypothetical protein
VSEKNLHTALKEWYASPDAQCEVPVDGYIIDVVRGDLLIEVQTRNFSAIKAKLYDLTARHPVCLAYPVAHVKWLVKLPHQEQRPAKRRKSPKRGQVHDVFYELVSFPALLAHPNMSLDVLLIEEEEVRRYDRRRAWRRRGWVTDERRLIRVVERRHFGTAADLASLLPLTLAEPFTTAELAREIGRPRRLAQRMAFCLHEMGIVERVGKRGRAYLYARATG